MRTINYFIQYNKLDPNLMKKFEEVFGHDWNDLIPFYFILGFFLVFPISIL